MTNLSKDQILLNLFGLGQFNDPYTKAKVDKIRSNRLTSCPTCDDRTKYLVDGNGVDCDCFYQKILSRNYLAANIGVKYHTLGLGDFISEDREVVVPVVEDYLEKLDTNLRHGIGITFDGPIGTGKTMSMCVVLKELLKRGVGAYFITFDELVRIVGGSWRDEEERWFEDKLKTINVLGLDELRTDARNANGFLSVAAEQIIRFRTDNNLPTFVTTNLSPEEEKKDFTKAFSLLSEKNIRVTTVGEDIRGSLIRMRTSNAKIENERKPIC